MITLEKEDLYPLLFGPVYRAVLWGGTRLSSCLHRTVPEDFGPVGESWEICDRPNVNSEVINGPLAGTTLQDLTEHYGQDLVGTRFKGGRFPVIVKIIDTNKKTSLQVHPDETTCQMYHRGEPKMKMLYVLDASPDASIYVGLRSSTTRQLFLSHLDSPDVENDLQCFTSSPGDAYFVNAGRINMISGGNLLLEIQQNSDTTYRLNDWGRLDETGQPRPLQREEGIASMDFMDRTAARISGVIDAVAHNRKFSLLNHCPCFHCDDLRLVEDWRDNTLDSGSFHILTAVNVPFTIQNSRITADVPLGYSVLIPACFGRYLLKVEPGITTTVIRTTL